MDKKKGNLIITLKSDLCAGSGYSYAGIIDSDICYDIYGIPYIPAKRLKGCLREAAGLIGLKEEEIHEIFGKSGQNRARGVFLGNAYIECYEELYNELKEARESVKTYMTPQNVLDQFTTIKAQTKIMDNGVAKDNSLRYIRTINHYSPLNNEIELRFSANVSYEEMTNEAIEKFENVVKALRNIGLNRNRGLGSVKCELSDFTSVKSLDIDFSKIENEENEYILTYSVRNLEPLVLNTNYDYITEKYISGQVVMGYFASAYLRNLDSEDESEFEELFLKDQVIFGGLYPEDRPEGNVYYPAPVYINQLKKTKKYVNTTKNLLVRPEDCIEKNIETEYATGEGNQPKKLKGKFVCLKEDGILVKEVDSDIIYHYTKKSEKQESQEGELLYAFEAVKEYQVFSGSIIGKGKYIRKLGQLLQQGELRFGKSKSSQYGRCMINEVPQIKERETEVKVYPRGSRIVVFLQSDGIFVNESGYTVQCGQVREQIREKLKIKEKECDVQKMEPYSEIEARMLTGYYSKWNLKRQAVPVVCAGSAFEFELAEEWKISEKELYVGIHIGEGYGRLFAVPNDEKDFRIQESKKPDSKAGRLKYAKKLFGKILLDEMREKLELEAAMSDIPMKNPAALGRVTLMLSDSISKYPDNPEQAYEDFCIRIDSIKTKETQKQINRIKDKWICEGKILSVDKLKYIDKILDLKEIYEKEILCEEDFSVMKGKFEKELKKLWSDYLMAILVREKYKIKLRECQADNSNAGQREGGQ